jgi:hypothetical protein
LAPPAKSVKAVAPVAPVSTNSMEVGWNSIERHGWFSS